MMSKYVLGADFGSDSVRVIVVNTENGAEKSSAVVEYPRWSRGEFCDASKNMFRQHPLDYLEAFEKAVKNAVSAVEDKNHIVGIAVDTTGSTPCPVNADGTPLALLPEFENDPDAMFYLWKDHTAVAEAKEISEKLSNFRGEDYTRFQGTYSSEWWWAKILHVARTAPKVKAAAYCFTEHCDWIPAILTGRTKPETMYRSACAAGHKVLWHSDFGGMPSLECLASIDPYLAEIASHYGKAPEYSTACVGHLTKEWADRLGLQTSVIIGGSSLDAHAGAVGAGIGEHTLVKVIGTSTVDMLVHKRENLRGKDLKDCCGQAENSILPGYIGIESSQAAFGDIYSWYRRLLEWPLHWLLDTDESLSQEQKERLLKRCHDELLDELSICARKIPNEDIPISLDWFNGRRYPIINETIKGGVYGLTLGTDTVCFFKSLALATVFGSRRVFDSFVTRGIQIDDVITVGGISKKSPFVMQMLSDVLKRPIKVSEAEQACAQGAAMYAAVAAGCWLDLQEAQAHMCRGFSHIYMPAEENLKKYDKLYRQYLCFGRHAEQLQKDIA